MYNKLLMNNQANRNDIIYLIGLHCTKSKKFKQQLLLEHQTKKTNILDYIQKMAQAEENKELPYSILFAIFNGNRSLFDLAD